MRKIVRTISCFLPEEVKDVLSSIMSFFTRRMMQAFWFFPIETNKIMVCCYNGKGFCDNPKYIALALHKKKIGRIYWAVTKKDAAMPPWVHQVRNGSLSYYFHMATAKVWIDNTRKKESIVKRKGQFYIQTWHGSFPGKKIEKDAVENLPKRYVRRAFYDSKMIDLIPAGNSFIHNVYRNAFWYQGEILDYGTPKYDINFRKYKGRGKIRKRFGVAQDDIAIIYAPTFRSYKHTMDLYRLALHEIKDLIETQSGRQCVFFMRLHPDIADIMEFDAKEEFVYDVTFIPDVQEIMMDADILITDYSGLMFEFCVGNYKPVFLYAPDVEKYDRGLYLDYGSLPFSMAKNMKELMNDIEKFDKKEYQKKLRNMFELFGMFEDGNASIRVAEHIKKIMQAG